MSAHFPLYLLESAGLLLASTLVYWLLFWRSTFLNWNRVLLLSILLTSIVLPLIHLPAEWTVWQKPVSLAPTTQTSTASTDTNLPDNITLFEESLMTQEKSNPEMTPVPTPIDYRQVLLGIYLLGVGLMSVRILLQVLSLLKLYRKARIEQRHGYQLAICPTELSPFAFGSVIFVPQSWFDQAESELILTHELAHVRQKHTFDILLSELNLVWQWFNPAAWLYRRLVEGNLEYLADRSVLHQHTDKKLYQLSLLNWVSTVPANPLSTSFNYSLLKERIKMMNRKNSPNAYALRYALLGLLLPLLPMLNQPLKAIQSINSETGQSQVELLDGQVKAEPITLRGIAENKAIRSIRPNAATEISIELSKPEDTKPVEDTIKQFYLVFDPNMSAAELEKLKNEKFPLGKKIEFITSENGKLIGVTMNNESGGKCTSTFDASDELPIVLSAEKNGCGSIGFSTFFLDKMISNNWPKGTKIITAGLPTDFKKLEPYRIKIGEVEANVLKEKMSALAANNWMEIGSQGSTGYRIPVKSEIFQGVKERIQTYIDAKKPFTVIVNGHPFKSSLPAIDLAKITKMNLFEDMVIYYYEGTLTPKRQDKAGLRLEIDTE
jgi:beta-lactamase regulating signal transducer with metallopeptidase domain